MIVFFDLPTISVNDKREYRKFRKFLISEGFIMMQESVYSKLLLNSTTMSSMRQRLERNKPIKGLVQALVITEKQFSAITYVVGKGSSKIRDDSERIVLV